MAHPSPQPEIIVAPDHYEITAIDTILIAELESAIAICVYDAVEESGALLHLRVIVRAERPAEITDSTLATELLLLDRCVEALQAATPNARHLQAKVVAHLADYPHAPDTLDTVLTMVKHFLTDTDIRLLPIDVASGPPRALRFRPSMGWMQTR